MTEFNKNNLQKALKKFKEYAQTNRFEEDKQERTDRVQFFQSKVKGELSELDFEEMMKKLWAMRIWGNKDYIIEKMKEENGFKNISDILKRVLSSNAPAEQLYESLSGKIKYMGPSMATELLCYLKPDKAGILNTKAKQALSWLGVQNIPIQKYRFNSSEYRDFNDVLINLGKILKTEGYKDPDLLFVDYFLWEITEISKWTQSQLLRKNKA